MGQVFASVCLPVSRITQKVVDKLRIFLEGWVVYD